MHGKMPTSNFPRLFKLAIAIPVIVICGHLVAEPFLSAAHKQWWLGENGPTEIAQFLILIGAAITALATLVTMNRGKDPLLTLWIAIALICCIYVAGEEVSWGQWFFYWDTPEHWAAMNDQGETNLHNTSAWLDQKPRLILEIGVYIGGLIIALVAKFRPTRLPARFNTFYPDIALTPLALGIVTTKIIQTITGTFYRSSELQELMLFTFVLFYLIILHLRARTSKHQ